MVDIDPEVQILDGDTWDQVIQVRACGLRPSYHKLKFNGADGDIFCCHSARTDLGIVFTCQWDEDANYKNYEVTIIINYKGIVETSVLKAENYNSFQQYANMMITRDEKIPVKLVFKKLGGPQITDRRQVSKFADDFKRKFKKHDTFGDGLKMTPGQANSNSLADDFKKFIEESEKVTLSCSNGDVQVSKLLLEMRSPALKAMFNHDTKESRDMKIDMKDFNTDTMKAYVHFLTTDELKDGKNAALGLFVFAEMYDIPGLKSISKNYILKNISEFDGHEVFSVMLKIDEKFVENSFLDIFKK